MKKLILIAALMLGATALACWWMLDQQGQSEADIAVANQFDGSAAAEAESMTQKIERSVEEQARQKRESLVAKVMESGLSWSDRVPAMEALAGHDLTDEDLSQLYAYLRIQPEQREEDYYVVANEIMEVLRENKLDGATYHRELLRLIEDPNANDVMRDYAIQHLTQWGEPDGLGREVSEAEIEQRDDAFLRMLDVIALPENRKNNFVGTALTSLRFGLNTGEFGDRNQIEDRLSEVVLGFASGEVETRPETRLTAIQVAAEMGLPETAEISRGILAAEQNSSAGVETDIHLSAIASLGLVGETQDVDLLRKFQNENVLSYAAKTAIKRIESRASAQN